MTEGSEKRAVEHRSIQRLEVLTRSTRAGASAAGVNGQLAFGPHPQYSRQAARLRAAPNFDVVARMGEPLHQS
jgi:hypothetical protein